MAADGRELLCEQAGVQSELEAKGGGGLLVGGCRECKLQPPRWRGGGGHLHRGDAGSTRGSAPVPAPGMELQYGVEV